MDVTQPIRQSFADEHVIGTDPPMRPELSGYWRRKINAFAGRALSGQGDDRRAGPALGHAAALRARAQPRLRRGSDGQRRSRGDRAGAGAGDGADRAGHRYRPAAARTSRSAAPCGCRWATSRWCIRVDQADALAGDGASRARPAAALDEGGAGGARAASVPRSRGASASGWRQIAGKAESAGACRTSRCWWRSRSRPRSSAARATTARPIRATIAYVDLRRIDGARLLLYLWPARDGGDRRRPRLRACRPTMRRGATGWPMRCSRPSGCSAEDEQHPWEAWGVRWRWSASPPTGSSISSIGHAVARVGGTPRRRSAIAPYAGDARLWQARLDQFTGQIAAAALVRSRSAARRVRAHAAGRRAACRQCSTPCSGGRASSRAASRSTRCRWRTATSTSRSARAPAWRRSTAARPTRSNCSCRCPTRSTSRACCRSRRRIRASARRSRRCATIAPAGWSAARWRGGATTG